MLLEVRDIHTYIGQFYILQGVSVSVPQGSITVLLGRNGAGKTTTLRSIMGQTPPREGDIVFDGKSLRGMRAYHIARLGIGYVPEHRAIFKDLTVQENLEIAERQPGDLHKRRDFIFEIFPDLKRLYHLPGGKLSGGQQQMLAVARVLVPDNRLLLIDEPSEGLAPVIIEQLMHAIHKLSAQVTVLLVEQNFVVARQLADRYTIIEEGQSVHTGEMPALVDNQPLIQRYLGAA
ncbi:MAG: ABC transporter ATP-binding protein [Anaerolineae bacterium]|nr:ABC transporter ATP-binding protein [Anaerolineae bacterium]